MSSSPENLHRPSELEPTPLVGFVGLKRSGKDTAAQALVDRGWTRMAFADPLKEMSMKLRGVWVQVPAGVELDAVIPSVGGGLLGRGGGFAQYHYVVDALGMEKAKDLVPDVRTLLQTLGTDCVRGTFGSTAWVELAEQNIHEALTRGESVAVTDVRFDEELDLVRRLGGITIGVWRGDLDSLGEALESASVGTRMSRRRTHITCSIGAILSSATVGLLTICTGECSALWTMRGAYLTDT